MSQQGSNFQSLEALRKHWSSRASTKRKQVEETSKQKTVVSNGKLAVGSPGDARPSEVSPTVIESRFGQLWLRDDHDADGAVESAPESDREGMESSDSEQERRPSGNSAEPKGVAVSASRHPPSLSVMRPLGDFGAGMDTCLGNSSSSNTTPRDSNEGGSLYGARKKRGPSKPPPSASAVKTSAWKQHQSSQQLSTGISDLARQVIQAGGQKEKEQAILKLYAVLCQTAWVSQPGPNEGWSSSYTGILDLGLPKFLKHAAALVLRRDRGYSDLVRSMAAAVLKTLTRWVEAQLKIDEHPETLTMVRNALEGILTDGSPTVRQRRANPREDGAEEPLAGYGSLLDTDALEGLLDPETTPSTRRSSRRAASGAAGGQSITDTHHMFGSLMDTGSLEALVSQNRQSVRPNLLGTQMLSSFGSALDTSDITGHMMEHKGALRATIWLFKSDQPDAWYAAASLVGSIALLGVGQIDAMGGPKLVKPLMWVLRNGDVQPKFAAMRALAVLSQDIACRTVMARQDKYLRAMARMLQSNDSPAKYMAVSTLNMLLAHDPSTHWVLARSGVVAALVEVMKEPLGPAEVKAEATLGLKHLTSSSQRNRDALLQANGLQHLVTLLKEGNTDAQYNSARILRHLAMGGSPAGKEAAFQAIPALVHGLKVGRPRVCFSCAAALAMVTEGQPGACGAIEREGGIQALVQLLVKGGGQGKKVAAEALQALAAESEEIRPKITASGCIKPLVQMLQIGNLQQQAAAAGAVQALAYCPSSTASLASALAGHGVIEPLVQILNSAPRAMRCAAAGSLGNLALRSHAIQGQIVEAGALEALVELLSEAQPDGQYSAAAALINLAAAGQDVRAQILANGALGPLIKMLAADSWYCRIVAADLIAHLGSDGPLGRQSLVAGGTLRALVALLCLQHTRGTLEEVGGQVAHLAYERSQDVIVMKGYKFARAKVAAAAALGILTLLDADAAATIMRSGPIADELSTMLLTGRSQVRQVAAAFIADLARASEDARRTLLQADLCGKLVSLLKLGVASAAKPKKAAHMAQPPGIADAALAARALRELIAGSEEAVKNVVAQGAIGTLMILMERGNPEQAADAAELLACLHKDSAVAKKVIKQTGVQDRILAARFGEGTNTWPEQGATALLLQHAMAKQLWGYAITAKPSANLYILLQVPFEALMPAGQPFDRSFGGRRASGRRKDLSAAVDNRRQNLRDGSGGGSGRWQDSKLPPMQSVAESTPLVEEGTRGEVTRSASDAEHWAAGDNTQPWRPQAQPPAGKSNSDILETWMDA